jgi:hypothetical protein
MPLISWVMLPALVVVVVVLLLHAVTFTRVDAGALSQLEQNAFEKRVKQADTILFGRFHWALPVGSTDNIDLVHLGKQNTFEFVVYCTIKRTRRPSNVPRLIRMTIEHSGNR